jgi:site-specific DNA-methyltransferase (adenine-specific)
MDCMDGMSQFPDKYFELAIVDPPYGIGEDGGKQRTRGSKKTNGKRKNWDSSVPNEDYFKELERVSKNQVIWGANYFGLKPSKSFIIWDKLDYGSDFADCEFAWTSFDSAAKVYKQSRQSNQNRPEEPRIHPTQKPVKLYKWILQTFAKPGDKIIDTHGGSFSSVIACLEMGFEYIAFEIDEEYYKKGLKRIQTYLSQPKIFTPEQIQPKQLNLL